MVAKVDIKESSRIQLDKNGYSAERVAIVSGVAGTAAEVLFNAINDSQLPDIGDAHPDVSNITLQKLSCEPLGGGRFRVLMTYFKDTGQTTTSSNAESRTSSGLAVEETHLDINGVALKTAYATGYGTVQTRQTYTAEVERPRIQFNFEYTAADYPTADLNKYLGKINSTAWNGYAPETILCAGIDIDQAGADFRVKYTFAYREETWQFLAKTRFSPPLIAHPSDPDAALDLDTGTRVFDVYKTVDFTPLGFTLETIDYTAQYNQGVFRITGSDAALTVA